METNQTPTLRSSTATLWAQIPKDIRSTLSTSRHAQAQHKRNTHVLALALIRLWTASESEGYTQLHTTQKIPLDNISPDTIHQQFVNEQPSNLGALTLVNLLLSNKDFPTSLSMNMNMNMNMGTADFLFTQQGGTFWSDYNARAPVDAHHFLTTTDSLEESLARALSRKMGTHAAWWQIALQGIAPKEQRSIPLTKLFQFEIFETALRIFLTPMPMIEQLADATLKHHDSNFNHYLFRKIAQFKERFLSMLSEHQYTQWHRWIARQGLFHVKNYIRYMSHPEISSEFMQHIVHSSIELSIPNLYRIVPFEHMRNFTINNKAQLLDYLIAQFEKNWQHVATQPMNKLWMFTDALVISLDVELRRQSTTIGIEPEVKLFLGHFMMACMSLKKHALIRFLVSQDDTLVHIPIQKKATLLPEDEKWANHSLLYFAQQKNHTEMVALLKSKGARLLMIESGETTIESPKAEHRASRRRASFFGQPQANEPLHDRQLELDLLGPM
tara:strand:- start:27407 stop:28903 length:1497 start_codon:yes stop_codon:yes gene_type:complete